MEKCYNVPCGVGLQFQMSPELMIFNIDRHKFVDRFTIYVPQLCPLRGPGRSDTPKAMHIPSVHICRAGKAHYQSWKLNNSCSSFRAQGCLSPSQSEWRGFIEHPVHSLENHWKTNYRNWHKKKQTYPCHYSTNQICNFKTKSSQTHIHTYSQAMFLGKSLQLSKYLYQKRRNF